MTKLLVIGCEETRTGTAHNVWRVQKTFSLGNMGICAVKSHATKSVKHQENVQRLRRQQSTGLPVNAFFTKMSSESSCKGKY